MRRVVVRCVVARRVVERRGVVERSRRVVSVHSVCVSVSTRPQASSLLLITVMLMVCVLKYVLENVP